MSNGGIPAVSARNLWKRFRLQKEPGGGFRRGRKEEVEEHWALRNIGFTVPAGGALGIIGANGSGKSTLLQIMAGVMRPTSGEIKVNGRALAVLNPTAGFHPDLTGRSNIQMLAALHGFSSKEIQSRIDPIVAFAGLD